MEAKSKMWVADLKMNGSARAVSFTPDGRYLVSSGSDGEVYRCVASFFNDGWSYTCFSKLSNMMTCSSFFLDGTFEQRSALTNFTMRTEQSHLTYLHHQNSWQ